MKALKPDGETRVLCFNNCQGFRKTNQEKHEDLWESKR